MTHWRRWGRPASAVLATLVVVVAAFVFVFPTQAWWGQQRDLDQVRADLETLRSESERLEDELERLADPAEIERLARERFHLVRPGEEAFALLPPGGAPGPEPAPGPPSG